MFLTPSAFPFLLVLHLTIIQTEFKIPMAFGLIYFHKYLKADFTPHFGTINKQTCIIFINRSRNVTYLAPEIATHVARLREIRVANIDGNFYLWLRSRLRLWFDSPQH